MTHEEKEGKEQENDLTSEREDNRNPGGAPAV